MTSFIDTARKSALFAGLSEGELGVLAQRVEPVEAREGQVIFAEGAAGDRLYVIGKGTVRIGKGRGHAPGTYARFLATLEAGDVFGEMALVLDKPRAAAAVASTACELHALSRSSFDDMLSADGGVGAKVLRNLATMLCLRLQRADDAILGIQDRSSSGGLGPADLDVLHARIFGNEGWSPGR